MTNYHERLNYMNKSNGGLIPWGRCMVACGLARFCNTQTGIQWVAQERERTRIVIRSLDLQKHYAVKEKRGRFGVNENSKCTVILTLVNAILFIWFFFCCFFLVKFDMFWRGPMKSAYRPSWVVFCC